MPLSGLENENRGTIIEKKCPDLERCSYFKGGLVHNGMSLIPIKNTLKEDKPLNKG